MKKERQNKSAMNGTGKLDTRYIELKVGDTPIKQLQWLLSFAQIPDEESLRKQLQETPSYLASEILAFADWRGISGAHLSKPNLIVDQFVSAWDRVRYGLVQLADNGLWCPGPITITPYLSRSPESHPFETSGRLKYSVESKDPGVAVLVKALRVIEAEGWRVRRCDAAECRQLFIKRKRAMFCTTKCMEREKKRLWRSRHPPLAIEKAITADRLSSSPIAVKVGARRSA